MFSHHFIYRLLASIFAICCFVQSVNAWQTITSELDIRCAQIDIRLECHYRPLFPGSVHNVRAHIRNMDLPVEEIQSEYENVTAIFFLIDTSDPGRQNVIDKNIQQIERLVNSSTETHRLGLASFDKKLRILAPVGSSNRQLIAASKNIKAKGRTTELYRNLLLTIEKLSRTNASRKAIYLFSDGQAEDRAYFHADVVKAARRKGIIINSIGFPRSISLSVALQTLRRLSEETGGSFTEADSNYNLHKKFYREPYNNVDAGHDISIDITALAAITSLSKAEINLDFATDIGNIKIKVPVSLSPVNTDSSPVSAISAIPRAPVQATIKMVAPVSEPEKIDFWLWYGLPITLVFLFLIALITLILIYRKQPDKTVFARNIQDQPKPFAYLVSQEENPKRYPIRNTVWRIGRSQDNELTLDDNSVSRLHAEIHRYNNGNFFVMDMKSLNGVYVNEEQVSNKKLQEGDILEIGDIYLRFTQHTEDYPLQEDTAIQKTKVPAH